MAVESSLNSRNEQIYIEVLVHHINLSSHKIHNVGTSSLCVHAEFIDLPSVEIRQEEFVFATKTKDESYSEKNCIDFSSGKSCLFLELPSNIFQNMNLKPLKIEIISKTRSQYLPLCETNIFFSDCNYCEKVSSVLKDTIHIPIIRKNIYDLFDHKGISGTIELSLNLSSRKSITFMNEFQNLKSGSKMLPRIPEGTPAGLESADKLPVIETPKASPKIKMGEPEFENLTTAEKLNDSSYRSLIYKTHPNEPTCGCGNQYSKKSRLSNCPGGCTNQCCSSSRRKSEKRRNYTNSLASSKRLRGGGEGLGNLEMNYKVGNLNSSGMCNNVHNRINIGYSNRSNMGFRLGGGGEEEQNFNNQNIDSNIPPMKQKNRCCCPDKEILNSVMQRRSDQEAIKKPCLGVDCLIKAYKDAVEFVDSIGKVPGLAGLGLMDPSESPYFGRSKEDDEAVENESKLNNLAPLTAINHKTKRNCSDVCNQKSKNTSMFPGRLGVIKEVVPLFPISSGSVLPGPKVKKTDETIEKQKEGEPSLVELEEGGPCGEPKCKSKRKKISVELEGNSILKKSSKLKVHGKNSKDVNKSDKGKNKYIPGPDEEPNDSKSSMKMARRIAKFVYSAGDTYPGLNYGHKTCVDKVSRVPANMGWLWQPEIPLGRLKPRVGWKPGAINAQLRRVLREVKANFWHGERPKSAPSRNKPRSATKRKRSVSSVRKESVNKPEDVEEEWKEPPPTLHIHRKDGVYYVTMYPIKQDTMDVPKLEIPTKPLQFKIMKNKDNASDISSSTASDMEIEFSPPAAVNRYRKKPDVIHVETQVKQQEILDAYKPPGPKKTEKKTGKEKKAKK